MEAGRHRALMDDALAHEASAQRRLLEGDRAGAAEELRSAARSYRASWEAAGPSAYGRLVGELKASVLAGDATEAAEHARGAIGEPTSPTSAYAAAIAALVLGDDQGAARAAEEMRGASAAFERAADAIAALSARDADAYRDAIAAIVADFEARPAHLTGVAIADTALMLERLAEPRGMASGVESPLLPPS
jgi:hypothetical protein